MSGEAGDDRVRVGQVYAGISGNRMVVTAIDGNQCELTYEDAALNHEEPWWEDSYGVAEYLRLVRDA